MPLDSETLVLGGGLAGSMVALELARAGRSSLLLEQSRGAHHKMCGEFLSGEAIHYLVRHGIDIQALGAVALDSVRLVLPTAMVEAALPFPAFSLTRALLDEEMLRRAKQAGVQVERGSYIDGLENKDGTWCAHLRDGRSYSAAQAFLATGKHDLRGWPRPAGVHRGLVAFKMYYRLTPQQQSELARAVELVLFPGGYAGLQPVEDSGANLCLLVSKRRLQTTGSNWSGFLPYLLEHAPHLRRRLEGAIPLLDTPLAASNIPYGHMQRTAQSGLWPVGDQAAVIPSFCGDGMAIALHSGALAVQHHTRGASVETYLRRLHSQLGRRLSLATRVSQLIVMLPQAAEIVRLFPALLPGLASGTRIPHQALVGAAHGDS